MKEVAFFLFLFLLLFFFPFAVFEGGGGGVVEGQLEIRIGEAVGKGGEDDEKSCLWAAFRRSTSTRS